MTEDLRPQLINLVEGLSPVQQRLVLRFIQAIRQEPAAFRNPASELVMVDEFFAVMTRELVFHHGLHVTPLTKKAFEYTFAAACKAAGWEAIVGSSATNPGADVVVEDVGFSLKTEGAQSIRFDHIHISKFRESAGTKGFTTTAQFAEYTRSTLMQHLQEYDRILMLRSFSLDRLATWRSTPSLPLDNSPESQSRQLLDAAAVSGDNVVYMLVEIPLDVLKLMGNLRTNDFSSITGSGSTSAPVTDDGQVAFTLSYDGSDNKVTIRNLRLDACEIHAAWSIPVKRDADG